MGSRRGVRNQPGLLASAATSLMSIVMSIGRMTMPTRRVFLASAAAVGASLATPGPAAWAQSEGWPEKPVKIVFPYAPGSVNDGAARIVAQRLTHVFGQPFTVENQPGANGMLAAAEVARAPADGYTLFWATTPQIAISPAMTKASFDPVKDLVPISAVIANPFVLLVHPMVPARTVSEFVTFVRMQPHKLVYAEAGTGSIAHLSMALFLQRAGLEMTHLSYKGNAPALQDVLGGHVLTMFSMLGDALPHAASGTIRLLAVSSDKRAAAVPNIPTLAESGFPGFHTVAWSGLMAPAGTPDEIVNRIGEQVSDAVKNAKVVESMTSYGVTPLGTTRDEFASMITSDIALWAEAVRIAGLKQQ
jgi:tripartite-type tricarboxylate transporter receptor subunit TctC